MHELVWIKLNESKCMVKQWKKNTKQRFMGWDSSVGIATHYRPDGPGIESQWDEIFSTRPERPWGPNSLLYNGYRVSFPGVKRLGHDADHPTPSSVLKVKERVQLCLYSLSGSSLPVLRWPLIRNLPETKNVSCASRAGCCWGWNRASKFQNEFSM